MLVAAALAVAGCNLGSHRASSVFPSSVEPDWRLESAMDADTAKAPEIVRRLGVRAALDASYRGRTGRINVLVYRMGSGAAALEVEQNWRIAPGTLVFHRGRHFVILTWMNTDRAVVQAFARDLGRSLD